jgi:hypothetical protein
MRFEPFSQGICRTNKNEFGYLDSYGVCIPQGCPKCTQAPKCTTPPPKKKESPKPTKSVEDFETSICIYSDKNCKNKFGIRDPKRFGKKCIPSDEYKKYMQERNNTLNSVPESPLIVQSNNTECFDYPKNSLYQWDSLCQNQYGRNYGVKSVSKCPNKIGYQANCEKNYQLGVQLLPNSTKCVPIGTNMNQTCNNKFKNQPIFKNYLNVGYQKILLKGCPQGTQRALCSGDYYNGQKINKFSTSCFPQNNNSDLECQKLFGIKSYASEFNSQNCAPGFIRAICT